MLSKAPAKGTWFEVSGVTVRVEDVRHIGSSCSPSMKVSRRSRSRRVAAMADPVTSDRRVGPAIGLTWLPTVSHQAVYDVLRALTDAGLVRRIQPSGSVGAGTLERYSGATISKSRRRAQKWKHQPSRPNGIVTKRQQSNGREPFPGACCLLVLTGLCRFSGQRECSGRTRETPALSPRVHRNSPAARASWETPEYGYYTGHDPSTAGTAVNAPGSSSR